MPPLKWVMAVMAVGTLVMPVASQVPSTCTWLILSNSSCVQKAECKDTGDAIHVWEDCPVGEELFEITDTTISIDSECEFLSGTSSITLKKEIDAESDKLKSCVIVGRSFLYFFPVDINEFHPYPTKDTAPITEVNVKEGQHSLPGLNIYYKDDDDDETQSLDCAQISSGYEDLFSLTAVNDGNTNFKTFTFLVKKQLDFESQVFYKVEYNIISTDEKHNLLNSKHTFFVYVEDMPDNKPFWTDIVPVYSLEECKEESFLFKVTAQDRDVDVNYAIEYSMVEDGGGNYFDINETTGEVSRIAKIDREALLTMGISSFSLTINATEYMDNGTEGEQPNSVEQVTTILIMDCNDNIPHFDLSAYNITMDELTDDSGSQELNLKITVSDMDKEINGSYKLTTNDTVRLSIAPEEGKQTEDVILTALFKDGANYFNYEVQEGNPLTFTITVTEDADPSHTNTAYVTIILRDVNDCPPNFTQSSYKINVNETKSKHSELLTVKAGDNDVNDEFGTPSIRYSLASSCHQLEINDVTGLVTLAIDLDYDDENADKQIHCQVSAKDKLGTDLSGTSEIIIDVIDVVDEPPWMEMTDISLKVAENSAEGKLVGSFIVNDLDNEADIDFIIVSSVCSGDISTQEDVNGWFTVVADTTNHPQYPAIVEVNGGIDREACSEVTLFIMAVDLNTETGTDNVTETVIIAINDVKDELPRFEGKYDNLNINEFDGLKPPPEDSVLIFLLRVSDPDEGDTINLKISKGGNKVELSTKTVTVAAGKQKEVEVRARKDADIDREKDETIEVEITLNNPNRQASKKKKFIIHINDLNDNMPQMNRDSCDRSISVLEDDGSRSINGTIVFSISATDADMESPYNVVSYYLLNDQNPDTISQRTPFTVDETTGQVSVLLIEDKKTLDREQYEEWELLFIASDQCRVPVDTNCKVQSSEPICTVKIIVQDVNDNDPRDLKWIPQDTYLEVDDFLTKDDFLKYTLSATDDDSGMYASLTYEVLGTFSVSGDEDDKDLFYAKSDSNTCQIYATMDFQGMKLTGQYNVILEAKDGGNRTSNFTVPVIVEDANDQPPLFVLEGCPGEDDISTIRMAENAYRPGEDGRPSVMPVRCSDPDGIPYKIKIIDADIDDINKKLQVEIDIANSTVDNAQNGNADEQLKYWSLEPTECLRDCNVQLYLSHQIDREKGTAYNLSLHVKNTEPPLQESWVGVRVEVTNIREYDPYFCVEGNCSYIVYMYENDPKAEAYFMEATDLDNANTGQDDDPIEDVFYFIKGGDSDSFQTYSDKEQKIILKNMPDGLDREGRPNYSLQIFATNDPSGGGFVVDNTSRSDLLHLNIRVGDVNDQVPNFINNVIFTSFMKTDKDGIRLTAIEADDLDLNETLTYTILNDIQWHDTDAPPDKSFTLEFKDARSVYLKLAFDPKTMTQGYCNFTIHVEDAAGHTDEAEVKVYIINEDYQVSMYFSNQVEEVKNKENGIEQAFTDAYGYTCVIDSITATQAPTGESLANETTVYMHFIDEENNKPVPDKEILELSNNADVMKKLQLGLSNIDISLDSVDSYFPPITEKSPEEKILTLKILLGVVSLVLGSLLVLLITISCIRTRSLKRKVKVLSTNTFGSKESGLNHIGHDMVPVPGSNLAKVHGNHNPVFSENGAFEMKNQDTGSISSGDSVLVGVEDNPEFKNYSAKGAHTSSSRGYENPSFGRSIDEVSAPPPGVKGGMKGNPLLNLGGLQDAPEPEPSNDYLEQHIFGDAEGSEGDTGSIDQKINSNFTFS